MMGADARFMANGMRKRERAGEHECTYQNYRGEFDSLCLSCCFGFKNVTPVLLNARPFCDAVVSGLNFLIEDFEGALTNGAVLT